MSRGIFLRQGLRRQPELSHDFFHGNAFAPAFLKSCLRSRYGLAFLIRKGFVIDGRSGDGARDGVEHCLQEANHSSHLAGSQPLDEFVRLLFVIGKVMNH